MMFYDILGSSYVHSTLLRFNLIQPDVVVDISENLQGRPHGGSDTRGWLDLTQALVEFIAEALVSLVMYLRYFGISWQRNKIIYNLDWFESHFQCFSYLRLHEREVWTQTWRDATGWWFPNSSTPPPINSPATTLWKSWNSYWTPPWCYEKIIYKWI